MTQEEKDRMSNQRGMVTPSRLDSGLGMQGVPAFPSNFSNIGPSEQNAGPTRFSGGVPATMGIGGINAAYPSSLGLSGRDYAPMRDQSGETIYRGGTLGLPQAQAFGFGQSATFAGGGELRNEGYNFRQPLNGMALAPQTSIPIEGGALSVGINRAQTAGQMGRTAIQTPYGTMFATEQQAINSQTPRTAAQSSSRTPQQQQELLDNIRKNAPALNQQRTDWVQNTIQQRRENPTTYTTPSGKNVAVPTNRFGEPLKAWMDQLGGGGRLNYGPSPSPQTVSAASSQPSQGVRFSPTPSRPIPMPVVDSAGQRIGVTSDFPASGGGPQPASPMLAGNSMVGRTRKRLFGTV